MTINNFEILNTKYGKIEVVFRESEDNMKGFYYGKVLLFPEIYIYSATIESCLIGLKNYFEFEIEYNFKNEMRKIKK